MDERTPIAERTLEMEAGICVCSEAEPCMKHARTGQWQEVLTLKGALQYRYNYGYSRNLEVVL